MKLARESVLEDQGAERVTMLTIRKEEHRCATT